MMIINLLPLQTSKTKLLLNPILLFLFKKHRFLIYKLKSLRGINKTKIILHLSLLVRISKEISQQLANKNNSRIQINLKQIKHQQNKQKNKTMKLFNLLQTNLQLQLLTNQLLNWQWKKKLCLEWRINRRTKTRVLLPKSLLCNSKNKPKQILRLLHQIILHNLLKMFLVWD